MYASCNSFYIESEFYYKLKQNIENNIFLITEAVGFGDRENDTKCLDVHHGLYLYQLFYVLLKCSLHIGSDFVVSGEYVQFGTVTGPIIL